MRHTDTLNPQGHLRPVNEFKEAVRKLGFRARWNDGGDPPEGTPLPEAMISEEGMGEFKTVENLRDAYRVHKSKTFIDFMGDEAKNDPNITRYKTGEEFAKGFKAQSELVGKKGVIIPDEASDDVTRSNYRKAMDIPDSAEGYNLKAPEGLHGELEITPESMAGLKALAHRQGLSNKQAEGVTGEYFQAMSAGLEKRDEHNILMKGEAEASLRNEWGKDFDANATIARRLVEKYGGSEAINDMGDLGNKPGVMKFLANLGKTISEDSFVGVGSLDLSTDATGAKQRIKAIAADPDFMNPDSPRHAALVEENTRLFAVAYSE